MTGDPLALCVAGLMAAYPRQPVEQATVSVYVRSLRDLPTADVEQAVRYLILTSTFFPTIAEIRTAAAEHRLRLPSAAEAMRQLATCTVRGDFHPLVWEARSAVGDPWSWRHSESPSVLVGQARKVYEDLRRAAVVEAVAPPRAELTAAVAIEVRT